MNKLKHLVEHLQKLIDLYLHYKTGTVRRLARDTAIEIAKELTKPARLEVREEVN